MLPSDDTIFQALKDKAPQVAKRLLSSGKRLDLLDDAIQDSFLEIRNRVRAEVSVAESLTDPKNLAAYVTIVLSRRIIALLAEGSRRRIEQREEQARLAAISLDDPWPEDFDVEAALSDLTKVCSELKRPSKSPLIRECRRCALWVLHLFLSRQALPNHPLAEEWFTKGRRTLRHVVENVLHSRYDAAAKRELGRALLLLRPLLMVQSRQVVGCPQPAPGGALDEVVQLVTRFRAANSPAAYSQRLNYLPFDTFVLLKDIQQGASADALVAKLAEHYRPFPPTAGEAAPDELLPARLELFEHLRKIRQAFWHGH